MATLLQDIRFGLRLLCRDRSFTITALLTLAVCIGANAAMFSVVRSVLLKPLPFPGSERVVLLYNSYPNAGAPRVGAAVPDLFDRHRRRQGADRNRRCSAAKAWRTATPKASSASSRFGQCRPSSRSRPSAPSGAASSTTSDGEVGQNQKVLLTHAFWQRRMAGRDDVVGQTDPAERAAVRGRRRAARVVLVSAERHRPVHAGGVRAGRQWRRSPAQQQLADGGPHGRRRHGGSGAAAGGRGQPRESTTACRSSNRS